jgi:hypothetical protein
MRFLGRLGRPAANEPRLASFLVLIGAAIIGLRIGETLFSRSYGLPRTDPTFPWWYAAFFALAGLLLLLRCEGRTLQIAFGLFAARYILAVIDPLLHGNNQVLRETLSLASAVAFVLAGWPAAPRWVRVLAVLLCVVAIPVRYRALQTVYGVRSVVDAGDHIVPIRPGLHPIAVASYLISSISHSRWPAHHGNAVHYRNQRCEGVSESGVSMRQTALRTLATTGASILLVTLSLAVASCVTPINRAKADERAREELERYAKRDGDKLELFTKPKVVDFETSWLYTYDYNGQPKHELAINVHRDGSVETSRMEDERH